MSMHLGTGPVLFHIRKNHRVLTRVRLRLAGATIRPAVTPFVFMHAQGVIIQMWITPTCRAAKNQVGCWLQGFENVITTKSQENLILPLLVQLVPCQPLEKPTHMHYISISLLAQICVFLLR